MKKRFFDNDDLPLSTGLLPCDEYPDVEKRGRESLPMRDLRALNPSTFVDDLPLSIPGTPSPYSGFGSIKVPTSIISLSLVPSPSPSPVPHPPLPKLAAATVTRDSTKDVPLTAGNDYRGLGIEVFDEEDPDWVNLAVLFKDSSNHMKVSGHRIAVNPYETGRYNDVNLTEDEVALVNRGDAVATNKGRIKVLMEALGGVGTVMADFRDDGSQTRSINLRSFNDKIFSGMCLLDRYSDMYGILEKEVGTSTVIMTGMFGGGTTPNPNFNLRISQDGVTGELFSGIGYDVKNSLLYALDSGNGKVRVWQFRPPGTRVSSISYRYANRDFDYTPVTDKSHGIAAYNNLIYIQNGNNVEAWSTT